MIKSTIKSLQKSIFFNIISLLSLIELGIFLIITLLGLFYVLLDHIALNPLISNILQNIHFKVFEIFLGNFLFGNIVLLYFFPIFAIIIIIACVISGIVEIKQANTNGYIINIPEKVLNSLNYQIAFFLGIITTITMCTLIGSLGLFLG